MLDELRAFDPENELRNVISEKCFLSKFGVRLPFCDKLSAKPLSQPIGRPIIPLNLLRFKKGNEQQHETFDASALSKADWVKVGTLANNGNKPMTAFNEETAEAARSTTITSTGPGGSKKEDKGPSTHAAAAKEVCLEMKSHGLTAAQAHEGELSMFTLDGDVLTGGASNQVTVTFSSDTITIRGHFSNARCAQSLLEAAGAEPSTTAESTTG
jgi:hypothetical protein